MGTRERMLLLVLPTNEDQTILKQGKSDKIKKRRGKAREGERIKIKNRQTKE